MKYAALSFYKILRRHALAKDFKDFTFCNKKFSDLSARYITASFGSDADIDLAMGRNMEIGGTNQYRINPNYFGDTWDNVLAFELNIIKNPCFYKTQAEREISKPEIREITRWLTSPHYPEWIDFEYQPEDNHDVTRYYGWFDNIETWCVAGAVYGLRISFKCTTPFGYTKDIINEADVTTYSNLLISNNSDELNNYCYPTVEISPHADGQIFICNLSDCNILDNGTLTLSESSYFDSLLTVVESYARLHGYTVKYTGSGAFNIIPLCNETAVQFYLIDKYGNDIKCTAFYTADTYEYRILENGFLFMNVYKDLDVHMDCQNLVINDSVGRMITYEKLGITDADHIYWLKLINGHNSLLLYGNAGFKFTHMESRKAGE